MATAKEAIDSDSNDSNQMKIVEPFNEVDPSPLPPPLPPPPPTDTTASTTSSAPTTSTDLSPSHQQFITPQQSHSPSSPPSSSQILNVSTSEDSSAITNTFTSTSTLTPTTSTTTDQQQELTGQESTNTINNLEEPSVSNIETNNSSTTFESSKIDHQPEPMTNHSVEDIEMKGDTANGVISNHDNSTESEITAPVFQSRSHGKKRTIDEVTRDSQEATSESEPKKLVTHQPKNEKKQQHDDYCWLCHKEKSNISCKSCPRTYHLKCLPTENSGPNDSFESNKNNPNNASWICIECSTITKSEDSIKKNSALSHLSPHDFSELLMFAVQTIKASADRSFHQPVSQEVFPDYRNFVIHPMDFSTIERNIRSKAYASTDALMADIKYIVHNCYIYNSPNHPLTKNANYFMKVAKNEMQEIEICPNCFRNFYTLKDKEWFSEPCARPHILVYAKMRGYPPWPAKVVRYDKEKNEVDVRFFGAHDRSWVPVDSCSLLTKPNTTPNKGSKGSGKGQKNSKYDSALAEVALHVKRLNELFPFKFHYAKSKQPIDVNKLFICDGAEDEEVSEMDDDRDSDLNEDKLVIDETGDDLETTANESIEQGIKNEKLDISSDASQPSVPEKPVKSEISIPKLTIPKSIKIPLRSQVQPSQTPPPQPISVPAKKDETPKSSKKKVTATKKKEVKVKKKEDDKEKEKLDDKITLTPSSNKKSDVKKKTIVKPGVEEEIHNKILEELEILKKKYEFEKMMHREQLKEIEHNHNLKIREMRDSWQTENDKALKSLTLTLEEKYRKEIEETKKKLWCSECLKEAMYFCCWNTSYCSLECQKAQWPKHAAKCQQQSHWQQTNSQSSVNQQNQQQQQQQSQQNQQLQPQLQSHNNNTTSYSSTVNQQA